jgi:uroporphyrinogen-III synthase
MITQLRVAARIMSSRIDAANPAHAALAGASVIVTRPVGSARGMLAAIRARGGTAIALPGLALRVCADVSLARAQLLAAQGAEACIFSSPAAVRFAFDLLPAWPASSRRRVIALGDGSARALQRRGVPSIVPPERSDSEGVLALGELAQVRDRRIVIIGAAGGRGLIASTLRERGAEVVEAHVYARIAPRLTQRHFAALAAADDPLILLLSSAEVLRHLLALLPPPLLARLQQQTIVVSSARLGEIVARQGFPHSVRATSARPRDLVAAAERALAHHRL